MLMSKHFNHLFTSNSESRSPVDHEQFVQMLSNLLNIMEYV